MDIESLTRRLPHYPQRLRALQDATMLMQQVRTLQPKIEAFSTPEGRSVTLFYLQGSVPVSHQGRDFPVPVSLFFDPPYPNTAPRLFVTPSAGDSIVADHPQVNAQHGMVNLPMLSRWDPSRSSVGELLPVVCSLFSSRPPIPVPPPPRSECEAKVKSKVSEALRSLNETVTTERSIQSELEMRNKQISRHSKKLENLKATLTGEISFLKGLGVAADSIQDDPLSLVKPKGPLANQFIDLTSEIAALEDYIFLLEKHLENGEIKFADYLRELRSAHSKIFELKHLKTKNLRLLAARS